MRWNPGFAAVLRVAHLFDQVGVGGIHAQLDEM
jgi:hypothetical protein